MSPPDLEQQILGYGDEAVNRPVDAILDDQVTADPLKKGGKEKKPVDRCKEKASGKTLVIVAGGWKYATKEDEIFAIEKDSWQPTTADFKLMAELDDDTPLLASSAKEFFEHIASQPQGSIGRVVFIGHGGFALVFSGVPGGIGAGNQLDTRNLADLQGDIDKNVKPKLHRNAKIDLVTCYIGGNEQFMDVLANAMDRCVRGFTDAVEVRNPAVNDTTITERGLSRILTQNKNYRKGWKHLRFQIAVTPHD
jgi:hypothetical protein